MITYIKILLQFGSFDINFIEIQLSFIILKKVSEISVHFRNFKIPLHKNIINILKFYVSFATYKFCKLSNISNSIDTLHTLLLIRIQIKIVTRTIFHKY